MNDIVLPRLVSIASTIKTLGLENTHTFTIEAVKTLLQIVNDYEVPMYIIGETIFGVSRIQIDDDYYCYEDSETGYIQQIDAMHCDEFLSQDPDIRAVDGTVREGSDKLIYIDVQSFSVGGSHYLVSNEEGYLCSSRFLLSTFYFLREHILKLNKQSTKADTETLILGKPSPSMQKNREIAFKFWLITKANPNPNNHKVVKDLQECYQLIGNPTQTKVWEMLKKIDERLFAHGKDDFFKKQDLIDFKQGTGLQRGK